MKVLNLSGIDGVADYHLPAKLKDAMCLVKTNSGNIELRVSSHLINSASERSGVRRIEMSPHTFL